MKATRQWSSGKADSVFSKWIRARDGKCLRCGTKDGLSCSHFWSRSCSALRYEPDNCITLCTWKCHIYGWENQKQGAYRDFMIGRLGQDRYDELQRAFYGPTVKRSQAIRKFRDMLDMIDETNTKLNGDKPDAPHHADA